MSEFWIYFEKGLRHILDPFNYDHILFLIILTVPYAFRDSKKMVLLITLFTVAQTAALILSIFRVVTVNGNWAEVLIPITIFVLALFNLFTAGKSSKKESVGIIAFLTLFFGIIHGFSFSALKAMEQSEALPLSSFSFGMELGQIIVVFILLMLSYIVQIFFRLSKRDWILVMSSLVIGVVLPMIIASAIWNR